MFPFYLVHLKSLNCLILFLVSGAGDTLATHGRGGAMRGRYQHADILVTRPENLESKQGKHILIFWKTVFTVQ